MLKYTTRTQLIGYGATRHLATAITRNLIPVDKKNRTNIYLIVDVINSIRDYLKNPRIKAKTYTILQGIERELLEYLNNIIIVPFQSPRSNDTELTKASKSLIKALVKYEDYMGDLKAEIATLRGKTT